MSAAYPIATVMPGRKAGEAMRKRIAEQITAFTIRHDRPPTIREIMPLVDCESTGHIYYHLQIMRRQGLFPSLPQSARKYMTVDVSAPINCTDCRQLRAEITALQARIAELEARS